MAVTWYCSSVSIKPRTATTWYWGALIADCPLLIKRRESCEQPSAATCLGPWLGSKTKSVNPLVLCSMPIMVLECPNIKYVNYVNLI